jgi:hypothetical protein
VTITLADLEQETARKVGPFYQLAMDRQVPTTATLQRAFFPALRSTVEVDLVTNLWLLRRGLDETGAAVPVPPDDRQRTVASYDPALGQVEVDRPWSTAPAPAEVCEFHHLDPEQELRPVVRAGLRRTFFEDRFTLGTSLVYEADLTAAAPWVTNLRQVVRVQSAPCLSGFWESACDEIPYTVFGQGGHVCIRLGGPCAGVPSVLVTLYRPHFTLVNGATTTEGPTADADTLEVDVDYAAAASHIEAWHNFPAKLQAAAAGNLQATQAMAALEFTRQARIWFPQQPDRLRFGAFVGFGGRWPLVVNA